MQNTQPKFKWHNEVIAWLNSEIIEFKRSSDDHWSETSIHKDPDGLPHFYTYNFEYRIKPKEVIKYAGIFERDNQVVMSEMEFNTLDEVSIYISGAHGSFIKFQKRTYLNNELIALELVKV